MRPVNFPEANTVFAKHQPEYKQLPAHVVEEDPEGRVTSAWGMSWKERFRVLLTGRVYLQMLTFRQPLQPVVLGVGPLTRRRPGDPGSGF